MSHGLAGPCVLRACVGNVPNVFIAYGGCDARRGGRAVAKTIHLRIDRDDPTVSLTDVLAKVQDIQRQHPELDVFFDGDEYAICSRPRKKA